MNKKSSISKKVASHTFFVTMLSITIIVLIAGVGIGVLKQNTISVSEKLGETAADDSRTALENQVVLHLQSIARNKADLSNEKLMSIQKYVKMLSENATEIMSNKSAYSPSPVLLPNPENDGIYTAQLLRSENVTFAELKEETDLIGNNAKLLLNIAENDEIVTEAYTGTESGAFIMVDRDSAMKSEVFDPRERGWYKMAKEMGSLIWTDVYDDKLGRGLAITCAAPYYDDDNNLRGVVGIGSLLINLNDIIVDTKIGKTGYVFVLNENGQIIISPHIKKDSDNKIIRDNFFKSEDESLKNTVQKMTAGESGIERIMIAGIEYYMAYEHFNTLPWSIAAVISVDEVLTPAFSLENNIITLKDEAIKNINNTIIKLLIVLLIILLVVVLTIYLMSTKISKRLTYPITELTDNAKRIGSGDFSKKLTANTGDEIEVLANTFNKMIDNIQTIAAEKERINTELSVAARIQTSMLPCIFPAFPDRHEFDVFALMCPAKEVGGDFYDFFMVDENTLAVIIADVSGKGISAALFMTIAKTLIKSNTQLGNNPNEVFETVNNLLSENNEAEMFVTAFMGYLDIPSGRFTYVNAGHNLPLINTGECFKELEADTGFILAGIAGMNYKQSEIYLKTGDCLFLYTDGLSEAMNERKELFGATRLLNAVNESLNLPLKEFAITIKHEIDNFAGSAEQADDMTMLVLKYNNEIKDN